MSRLLRLAGAVVACVLAAAPVASGQMGAMRAMGGMQRPNVTPRQVQEYATLLGLSEAQRKAAEELVSAYSTEYLAAVKRLEDITKSMQEEFTSTGDMEVFQNVMPDVMKKFQRRIEALEKTLLDDLKSLLDAGQLERWPEVERTHRRKTTISWGSVSGESLDLVEIVDGLRLSDAEKAPVAEILGHYAIDFDRELVARNRLLAQQMDEMWEGMMNQDFDKMVQRFKELRDAGRKIADINSRYARQIEGALPTEKQEEFDKAVKLHSYPRVYVKSYADRVIEAAEALPDLDQAQREGLRGIKEAHEREAGAANEKWAAAILESEADETNPMAAFGGFGQPKEGPLKDARDARRAIDDRTVDAVNDLLTESQRAKLPDKKKRPEFDFDAPVTK
jgi:hypothetical protein